MKRLLTFLFILASFTGIAQPAGYTNGTWANFSYNGRAHGYFKPAGWSSATDHILVWFAGDGADPAIFNNFNNEAPGSLLSGGDAGQAGNWNGITNLPSSGNIKWQIVVIGNSGNQPAVYAGDVAYFFEHIGTVDTSDHSRIHIGGLSGGPARYWDYLTNGASSGIATNSPYRFCFSTTMSLSCSSIFFSLTPIANNKKHYVWYGNPAGDGNSGTPYSFSSILYSGLPGTPNVDKRFKTTPTGTHSDNTWGIWNNTATCLAVTGTDTATNRWLWMIYAYGAPGVNNPPTANAGADQVVVLPTTTATLNGSASFDGDGTITSYVWTKISGPTGGTITSPSSATTGVTALQAGLYAYKLVVTDDDAATGSDTTYISVTNGAPSTYKIPLGIASMVNWTAKKTPEVWMDGSIASGNKVDQEFNVGNAFAQPMRVTYILGDSCYENIRMRFYHEFSTNNFVITFYDSTKTLLGTYNYTGGAFGWNELAGNPDTITKPIRFVQILLDNVQSDVREIEIYGDKVAKCSDIIAKNPAAASIADPGYKFQGGSSIGGKDTTYMTLASGLPLYGSMRSPTNMFIWNHDQTAAFNAQPIEVDKYGDFDKSTLRFHKRMGTDVMLYINGASIKYRPDLNSGSSYSALSQLNNYKDIVKGTDSTDRNNWASNTARTFKALTYLWGNNPAAVVGPSYNIFGTSSPNLSPGQGKIKIMEIGNEDDKTWQGVEGYHSPEVLLEKLIASYDSIKSIDPLMKVHLGALLSADTAKWRAMWFIRYWKYNVKGLPADGLNFNQYISTAYGGQPQGGTEDAISPEQFQIREKLIKYGIARDRYCPNAEMKWTEIGYGVGASDYNVVAVPGMADSIVQANFILRTYERAATVPNVLTSVYNYFHTSDGSGSFASMFMVTEVFDQTTFAYLYSKRRPQWFYTATRMNVLYNYKGWNSIITDGDTTGINVYRYDHKTDANQKVYCAYRGTYNGSTTTNYVLNIGSTATSATLVTPTTGDEDGVETVLTITAGNVTIPTVNEGPQYLKVVYNGSTPPVVPVIILKPGIRRVFINQ